MGLFSKFKKQEPQKQEAEPQTTFVGGVGRMPFPAYRGGEPYIFISYAHVDSERVFKEIKGFNENGYNVWYDEGIAPGNEWTDEIADALEKCALFVVFITPSSAGSPNVQNEINFAIDEKKSFIAIHLEETVLPAGIRLQIGTKQAILKYNMTDDEYLYKYTAAFTRLGLNARKTAPAVSVATKPSAPTVPTTVPQTAAVNEITTVGDFRIEHGLLHEYLGSRPDIKLPDEVQIIGFQSFGLGSNFIETVDLNKTGALLNDAFSNCPNLREVRIPRSVTMIKERPFVNCPNLTVYCYRHHMPANFEENFGGKQIVYLDDVSIKSSF
ncbi:MAG: TIR domain-containing protein [Syntrophomonas sp.]|nr:TIR domain-containing protein [Syntrophomonadaceae bacterium]